MTRILLRVIIVFVGLNVTVAIPETFVAVAQLPRHFKGVIPWWFKALRIS